MNEIRHSWRVGGSIPPKTDSNPATYARNVSVQVIASTAASAMALVERKYPGIFVHRLQHQGAVDAEEGQP